MTRHIDDSNLQDLLEGLLDSEAETEFREHLDSCPRCREELESLTELREELGRLPVEARPGRDLWPQISWRMGQTQAPGLPPELPSGTGRRVSLPAWQLLAASIALIVISGGTVWAVLAGRADMSGPLGSTPRSQAQMVSLEDVYGGYDEAVLDLEAVLEQGREVLDPETIRVLEENLRTIDQAIRDAETALMNDPASTFLQRFLADTLRKKVDLLRQAAGTVYAIT